MLSWEVDASLGQACEASVTCKYMEKQENRFMRSVLHCPRGISYQQVTITPYGTRKSSAGVPGVDGTASVRLTSTCIYPWTLALVDQNCYF